ncbi:MAG: transglutaminase-like cysteine peptidase [Methylovirgula sp.]
MRAKAIVRILFASSFMAGAFFADTSHAGTIGLQASYATLGGPTSVPYGWLDFCHRQPQECNQPALAPLDINLKPETWRILNKVNRLVNQTITPVSNYDHWGTMLDHWDYPTDGKGDCKIYALYKRKLLMDAGFPRQALLMTIVRDQNGEGHTILTVKTNRGEFILDNMRQDILSWDATGYHFYKRQSQQNPNIWVAIVNPNPRLSSLR